MRSRHLAFLTMVLALALCCSCQKEAASAAKPALEEWTPTIFHLGPDSTPTEYKEAVLTTMVEYMRPRKEFPDFDPGYTQVHVDRCRAILEEYLKAVAAPAMKGHKEPILAAAKTAIMELNKLNDECGGSLIETDQRELLVPLFRKASADAGYEPEKGFTEDWRDW